MGRREIVEQLGRDKRVERIIQGITHSRRLSQDLQDLAQMVYLAILQTDESKIIDLWQTNALDFFIVRIVINQWRSNHSPFRKTITKFRSITEEIRDIQREIQG